MYRYFDLETFSREFFNVKIVYSVVTINTESTKTIYNLRRKIYSVIT